MKKIAYISLLITLLTSCAGFEKIALFQGNKAPKLGTPALEYQNGNFTEGWQGTGRGTVIKETPNGFETMREDADKRMTVFYLNLPKGVDFRGNIALVLEAKAVEGEAPRLKLALIDDKGKIANGKDLSMKIDVSNDYKQYIYKLDGSFTQIMPELADVNAANIKRIEFSIDQGKKGYNGKIDIASIEAVLATEVYKQKTKGDKGVNGGVIADFSKESVKDWSVKHGAEVDLKKEKNAMVLNCKNTGPFYQSVSKNINRINLAESPIIKVRAKVTDSKQIPYLRVDLEDVNGKITNKYPVWNKLDGIDQRPSIVTIEDPNKPEDNSDIALQVVDINASGERYIDYYFDFSGRFLQSYPKQVELDPERIDKIILYVNPGFVEFTGKVYIQSIEAIQQ